MPNGKGILDVPQWPEPEEWTGARWSAPSTWPEAVKPKKEEPSWPKAEPKARAEKPWYREPWWEWGKEWGKEFIPQISWSDIFARLYGEPTFAEKYASQQALPPAFGRGKPKEELPWWAEPPSYGLPPPTWDELLYKGYPYGEPRQDVAIRGFGARAKETIALPEKFTVSREEKEPMTDKEWEEIVNERATWLDENTPREQTIVLDELGNEIKREMLGQYPYRDPNMMVTKVYALGDSRAVPIEMSLREALRLTIAQARTILMMKSPYAEEEAEAYGLAGPETIEYTIAQRGAGELGNLLETSENPWEIVRARDRAINELMDLYNRNPELGSGKLDDRQYAFSQLEKALSKEQQEALLEAEEKAHPGGEGEKPEVPEAPIDVEALTKALAPHGISVLPGYPHITPMSEAHFRSLSAENLEMLDKYLREKGMSLDMFMSISQAYYGVGRAAPGARWAIPTQW